jgi:hypothetical protein
VRTSLTNHHPGSNQRGVSDAHLEHYIETAAGQQRFCEYQFLKGDEVLSRSTHYGDGNRFVDIQFDNKETTRQKQINVNPHYFMEQKSERRQVPDPLLRFYVGREPLHKALLTKAKPLGEGKVMGRECNVFLFPQVRWGRPQDQVYFLDKETSIPLKVETYWDEAARLRNDPMGVWTAESLDQDQGYYLPHNSTGITFGPDKAPAYTNQFKVESVVFNKEYPASTFWPTFQPGVNVFDSVNPGATKVSDETKVKPPVVNSPTVSVVAAPPIEAVPPSDSTPMIALGLGVAVLFVGVFLWWQRARS